MSVAVQEQQTVGVREIGPLRRFLNRPEVGSIVGLVLVWGFFAITAGGSGFLSVDGAANYLDVAAQFGIVASAVTLLMIGGEFDLSIGSMVGFGGMLLAIALGAWGWPLWLAILATFVFALAIGFINGFLVVRTGLPSFIVTLAMLFSLRGAAIAFSRGVLGRPQFGLDQLTISDPLARVFSGHIGIFSVGILWWIGLAILATYILNRTVFGNWIFGSGGSASAARALGVPVARVKVLLFMATSACAALLAVHQVLDLGAADALRGEGKEFEAVIVTVIGGAVLFGGYGSPIGSVLGAITLGIVSQGLIFLGIESDWYQAVLGVLLLLAVLINNYIRARASESHR